MFGQRAAALSETSQMPKVAEHGVAFISGFHLHWGSTSMKTVGGAAGSGGAGAVGGGSWVRVSLGEEGRPWDRQQWPPKPVGRGLRGTPPGAGQGPGVSSPSHVLWALGPLLQGVGRFRGRTPRPPWGPGGGGAWG